MSSVSSQYQFSERPSSTRIVLPDFIPQFDGLRGIAILAVMLTHSEPLRGLGLARVVEYGRLGVDLFFVLSGFLITGILLDSRESKNYYRNFYARRALRIWPLYYLVLAVFLLILPQLTHLDELRPLVSGWPYLVFYLQNFVPMLNLWALSPTWSLAIEEQYYMVWPTVVRFWHGRRLPILLAGLMLLSLSLRVVLYKLGAPMNLVHRLTFCRLESIAIGSLAAWWIRQPNCSAALWRKTSLWLVSLGIATVLLARFLWGAQSTVVSYFFVAVLFGGVLGLTLVSGERDWLRRALCQSWLRFTGKISYGLYLIHMPAFFCTETYIRRSDWLRSSPRLVLMGSAIAGFVVAFGISTMSWRFFESPLLRLKRFFPAKNAPA